ncbi:glutamine amidotransferase-related protein [Terrisporobacter glycolicus]|uniref:glutamine amidotransferase-related protein n=1 Tax=Terrisporobacter glycolicus TaxID=36841 RepID=UPI003F5B4A54
MSERHRHRYEFNNKYRGEFINSGMIIGGTSPDDTLVESVEIPKNAFFVGVQYHPEFKSRPNRSNPIIKEFIKSTVKK